MASFVETNNNNIIIDNIEYTRQILCNNIELIQKLQVLERLDPSKKPEDYSIDCSKSIEIKNQIVINTEENRVGIEFNEKNNDEGIGIGGFNTLYKIGKYNVKNKPDEPEEKELVIRITNNEINVKDNINNNEINGLFLQHYISKKCPYVCKVYEFGYLIKNEKEERVYAILEYLKTPDLLTYLMLLNKENKENKENEVTPLTQPVTPDTVVKSTVGGKRSKNSKNKKDKKDKKGNGKKDKKSKKTKKSKKII